MRIQKKICDWNVKEYKISLSIIAITTPATFLQYNSNYKSTINDLFHRPSGNNRRQTGFKRQLSFFIFVL